MLCEHIQVPAKSLEMFLLPAETDLSKSGNGRLPAHSSGTKRNNVLAALKQVQLVDGTRAITQPLRRTYMIHTPHIRDMFNTYAMPSLVLVTVGLYYTPCRCEMTGLTRSRLRWLLMRGALGSTASMHLHRA